MNIKEAMDACSTEAKRKRAATTARTYAGGLQILSHFLETQHVTPQDDISKISVDHFINATSWILDHGYKRKSLLVMISAFKYFLDWLVIQGLMQPTYQDSLRLKMAFADCYRKRADHMVRHPKADDVAKIIAAASLLDYSGSPQPENERARNKAMMLFLATSGCRNFEICALKVRAVDLKERKAVVIGKGDKERFVYISQDAADALRYYWAIRGFAGKNDPVFNRHDRANIHAGICQHSPITTNTVRNIVDACCAKAGIEKGQFTPHYFRHAFAIKMLHDTGNLALVQDLLGHADPKSTRVYAKISDEDLRDAHREAFK